MDIFQPSPTAPSDEQLLRWRQATALLDYGHPSIQSLITQRGWMHFSEDERIGAVYNFVRDGIAFGYNASDDLPASTVLADGIGQCNTKGTLLMALLRAVEQVNEAQKGLLSQRVVARFFCARPHEICPTKSITRSVNNT